MRDVNQFALAGISDIDKRSGIIETKAPTIERGVLKWRLNAGHCCCEACVFTVMPIEEISSHQPLLFEVSLEVCNQVGGIYTVLRTKAQAMVGRFEQNYVLVGPYIKDKALLEFEATAPPPLIQKALGDALDAKKCFWGRWLVPGEPNTLLVNTHRTPEQLNEDKQKLWDDHGISTISADALVDEAISFGFSVAEILAKITAEHHSASILHAHEWLAGVALLRCKFAPLKEVKTVFTTHATLIGRYEAGNNPNFYEEMPLLDPEDRARYYGIESRHGIEREAARSADTFTTVSDVTGREAEVFLRRGPDAILPNGLNVHHFPALHEFQNLHLYYKKQINEFVRGHFFPSYTFDLDQTLYLFTSGRYEYRNKGMDIFLDSLSVLRERLLRMPSPPTVIAFIVTRAETVSIKAEVLKGQLMFHDLRTLSEDLNRRMGEALLESIVSRKMPSYEELLSADSVTRIKRATHAFTNLKNPAVVTHDLVDEKSDPVIAHLERMGFCNAEGDPVKIIFHPEFVTGTSPLFGLDYDQFVRGCHMGVFPSYYEPWGYTPLECIALGIPTVTTDLSGFGSFVQNTIPNAWEQGIMVLNRSTKDDKEVVVDLATNLFQFCKLSRRQRIDQRNRAERLTETFDWSSLSKYYLTEYKKLLSGNLSR